MITDIYGESGSGKTQLCFTLAVNCAQSGGNVLFVDTAGTFRPERILEIGDSSDILEKITYLRALSSRDQIGLVDKISEVDPQLVIVDSVTSLFSVEYSGPARHLAVMRHLHDMAISAIISRCAVVVTNMIRDVPPEVNQKGRERIESVVAPKQKEYLGSSVSIYSHMKLKLQIVHSKRSVFQAKLMQPPLDRTEEFHISARGICDLSA